MKLPNPFRRWARKLQARYDGAKFSFDRSWLPGLTQSAINDITSGDRIELLRRARYFEKNSPLANRLLDLIETNVVGTGINPTPMSSDEGYNKRALEWFEKWCQFADLTSRQHFYTLQAILARGQAVDGDIFVFLTKGESGRPRIQLIESHRVQSAALKQYSQEGYIDADGVLLDPRGRPAFYVVQNELTVPGVPAGSVTVIPADSIVHFFEPGRAGQYRGVTIFHPVLITLHDLDDLQRYEMIAAKDAASRSNIVSTENGELPASVNPIARSMKEPKGDGTTEDRVTYYERAFGGKTITLRRGDKWEQSQSLRPSAAMREFWEYLTEQVCRGVGISYAALKDYGTLNGAAIRGAITADNRFYEVRTQTLTDGLQRIYEYVIGWANDQGELGEVPEDWNKVQWQPPRRSSVDIGRDSVAMLNELRGSVRTYRDTLGEMGLDWRDVLTQRAAEEAFIDKLAADTGVDRTRIAALDPNERSSQGGAAPDNADSAKAQARAVFAKAAAEVFAVMQSPAIDIPADGAAPLPSEFVWMPAGTHAISAGSLSGGSWKGKVVVDAQSASAVKSDFQRLTASGQRVWIDFNHEDAQAAGWVKDFSWDPTRGIICSVEWTPAGEQSLRGKSYYSFSPAFLVDQEGGRVRGLLTGHAAGGLVNAPAFGAAMPALIAARLSGAESLSPESGGTPELQTQTIMPPEEQNQSAPVVASAPAVAPVTPVVAPAPVQASAPAITPEQFSALLASVTALQAEVKASKPKAAEPVVVAPAAVEAARAPITAEGGLLESVKAFSKETDHKARGKIYVASVRAHVAKVQAGLAEILAANSLGSVVGDIIVLRALDFLKYQFPVLSAISSDFSDQQARQGQVIKTRIVGQPAIVTLDDAAGWSASDATTTDVSVTIGQPKGVMINYTSTELAGTQRDLFQEQVEACHYALAEDLVGALYALINATNFSATSQKTTVALSSFARTSVVAMGTAMTKRKVRGLGRTLLLNPDYFGQLSGDQNIMSLAAFQDPTLITARRLPNVSDFNVIEAGNLPATVVGSGHIQGFGFTKDALVMATRVPEDYTRALPGASNGALSVVTNPDTGISVQKVDFVDHKLAKAYSRIAWAYGVAKGQTTSGQLLVEA